MDDLKGCLLADRFCLTLYVESFVQLNKLTKKKESYLLLDRVCSYPIEVYKCCLFASGHPE